MNTPPQSYRKQSGNSLRVIKISTAPSQAGQDPPENQLKRGMPHNVAAKHISNALSNWHNISDVEVLGVDNTKTGYLMRFRTDRGKETATKTYLAIGRLRHLRPKQMRQLYQECMNPQMDYASTVWHSLKRRKWRVAVLSRIQRIATAKAISTFRTVGTETVDYENL